MKRKKIFISITSLLIVFAMILLYYQFFFKSTRVNGHVAILETSYSDFNEVVTSVRFLAGDSLMACSSADSTIKIYSLKDHKIVRVIKQMSGVACMDVSSDGKLIITGGYDSKVRLFKVSDGSLLREMLSHTGTIWTVNFSHDMSKAVSGGDDKSIIIWDVNTGQILKKLEGHTLIVWVVKFSKDDSVLASGSFDASVKLWNVEDGKLIWNNTEHTQAVVDLSFSDSGALLATTSDDKTIRIWDWRNKILVRSMEVPEHVQAVAFSPDDKLLVTGGRDKPMLGELLQTFMGDSKINKGVSARIWNVSSGKLLQTLSEHENDVQDLSFSKNGRFATASADHTIQVWKLNK